MFYRKRFQLLLIIIQSDVFFYPFVVGKYEMMYWHILHECSFISHLQKYINWEHGRTYLEQNYEIYKYRVPQIDVYTLWNVIYQQRNETEIQFVLCSIP